MTKIYINLKLPDGEFLQKYIVDTVSQTPNTLIDLFKKTSGYDNFVIYHGKQRLNNNITFHNLGIKGNDTLKVKRSISVNYSGKQYEVIVGKIGEYLKATILNSLKSDIKIPPSELIPPNFELKIGSDIVSDSDKVNTNTFKQTTPYTLTYKGSKETYENHNESVIPYDRKKKIGVPIGHAINH